MDKRVDRNTVIIAHDARHTSRTAALKALPRTGSWRAKVYDFIQSQGFNGATDQEIESALKLNGNTVRPTRITLLKDGFIFDSGGTRKNINGNDCIVWLSSKEEGRLF
jgi:hypothetical protein